MAPYVAADSRKKIGHITPSSNTVLEPLTVTITRDLPVSHHFTRIPVEEISLATRHTSQFAPATMLDAAVLLADSVVDVIVWNGTSGGWNGIDADQRMCAQIEDRTGIPASTATLAQLRATELLGITRVGLATPYTADVAARIRDVYTATGLTIGGVSHLGISVNRDFAHVTPEQVRQLLRDADSSDVDGLLFICTGVAAAQLVAEMEAELGKPIIDTTAVITWEALRMVGLERALPGWGKLLAQPQAAPTEIA